MFIGLSSHPDPAQPGSDTYVVVSLRGVFVLQEASNFILAMMDSPTLPKYEEYFTTSPIFVHSTNIHAYLPIAYKHRRLRYYIDHYSVLDYISQYEWEVARHDIHQFSHPDEFRTTQIFGDLTNDDEPEAPLGRGEIFRVRRRPA